ERCHRLAEAPLLAQDQKCHFTRIAVQKCYPYRPISVIADEVLDNHSLTNGSRGFWLVEHLVYLNEHLSQVILLIEQHVGRGFCARNKPVVQRRRVLILIQKHQRLDKWRSLVRKKARIPKRMLGV